MISIRGEYKVAESLTAFEEASEYTNYYEFSTGKRSVKKLSEGLKTSPWKITVDGEVDKSLEFDVKELTQKFPLEERIYRWRCVEAWSMVIPWIGFSLKEFIKLCAPNSRARFVEFTTLLDADQMPGVKSKVLPWPYREALRMDEALHPLTMMVVGMYDELQLYHQSFRSFLQKAQRISLHLQKSQPRRILSAASTGQSS